MRWHTVDVLCSEFLVSSVVSNWFFLSLRGSWGVVLYSYTVPPRTVVFETPGAVTYAGNNVTLNCATNLLGGVTDSDVTVNSRWTKDGAPFSGVSGWVTLTPATSITSISYITRLMFSPLSSSMDNGTYMCITTLTPPQPQFVTGSNANDSRTLAVRGEITQPILFIIFSMQYTFCHIWLIY